jgi:predicted AlkP superfamily phosphohydrolase/phosphomutase
MRKRAFFTLYAGIMLAAPLAAADIQSFLIIGVDGVSTKAITAGHAPRIRDLMARGAWTLNARGVMPTLSSPNWASMINGATPAQHGITSPWLVQIDG